MSSAIERGGDHMYYAFSAVVSFFCVAIALVVIIINSIKPGRAEQWYCLRRYTYQYSARLWRACLGSHLFCVG